MKPLAVNLSALCICFISISSYAQSPARSLAPSSDSARLDMLAKKIDEQNAKIDLLSQQILKLEQQLSNARPSVIPAESTPAAPITTSTSAPVAPTHHASPAPAAAMGGNTHTVERGETLTSIAKMYNVSVSELQKYNHIENDRKLQIGQTIMIPGAGVASPAPSASTPE